MLLDGPGAACALDIVTLNVWGLPWPFSRRRRQRLRAIAAHLGARTDDLVGMQEVWADAPWHMPALRPRFADDWRASGLALGGRVPPRERPLLRAFSRSRSTDRLARKGVLGAWVEVAGVAPIAVLVTHLQAGGHADVRAHQVDELLAAADAHAGPAVLMGDFNFHDDDRTDDDSDARLRSAGFVDAAAATGCLTPTWDPLESWRPHDGPAQRFDRIYVRSGRDVALEPQAASVLDTELPLSDHRPLWARVVARRVVT